MSKCNSLKSFFPLLPSGYWEKAWHLIALYALFTQANEFTCADLSCAHLYSLRLSKNACDMLISFTRMVMFSCKTNFFEPAALFWKVLESLIETVPGSNTLFSEAVKLRVQFVIYAMSPHIMSRYSWTPEGLEDLTRCSYYTTDIKMMCAVESTD